MKERCIIFERVEKLAAPICLFVIGYSGIPLFKMLCFQGFANRCYVLSLAHKINFKGEGDQYR